MSFSERFRTWNNDAAPAGRSNTNNEEPRANPFSRMREDRERRDRNRGPSMSYAEHKRKQEEERKEKEKNRPLTMDDFPALAGSVPVVVKPKKDANASTLANHLAATIKKDEEDAVRRRLEKEVDDERKRKEEGFVRLPLYGSVEAYFKAKRAEAEKNYAAGLAPTPKFSYVEPPKRPYKRPSMVGDDEMILEDYEEEFYQYAEAYEESEAEESDLVEQEMQ